jgi:hypothetical protein
VAQHLPSRATGPNAESCTGCHSGPFEDGSGPVAANVHRDPLHRGKPSFFIQRNTPHVFAPGAVQRLAEETSGELRRIRAEALSEAAQSGRNVTRELRAKGLSFGKLSAAPDGSVDTSAVQGVDGDLVVRPSSGRAPWPRCASSTATPRTTSSACKAWSSSAGSTATTTA